MRIGDRSRRAGLIYHGFMLVNSNWLTIKLRCHSGNQFNNFGYSESFVKLTLRPLAPSVGNCRIVDLSRNLLSDDISVLTNWNADLEILDLSSNSLTGSIPNLMQFQGLTMLSIRNNSLEGNLPSALGSLPKLNTVDLSSNRLDGLIPHSFFASMTLTNLNLSSNRLTGGIPLGGSHTSELLVLSSGPAMESLDLSNNLLASGLPSDIGNWGRLKLLNLAYNNLSGQLPNELSRLSVLEYLNLSHNSFSGNIPDKLPSTLKFFDVAYNNLSGKIPENLNYFPDSSFSGNNLEPRHGFAPGNHVPKQIQDRLIDGLDFMISMSEEDFVAKPLVEILKQEGLLVLHFLDSIPAWSPLRLR
ncbi:UNVERIFIED_CONTAM: hypothetical protein Sradi_0976300 [Sesamum radiatum]|uniref:Uncharacterized protein n=1 Tax=Sesamum radiatum TaxID=300843 RepID=A0AAW2V691_SESRA